METSRRTATQATSNRANITIHGDRIKFDRHSRDLILSEVKKVKKSDDDNVLVICSSSGRDATLFALRFDTKAEISKVLGILESYTKSCSRISYPLNPETSDEITNSNTSNSLIRLLKGRARSNPDRGKSSSNSQGSRTNSFRLQKSGNSTNNSSFFHASKGESSERSFSAGKPLETQKSIENNMYRNRSSDLKSVEMATPPAEIQIMRETPNESLDISISEISSSTSTLNCTECVPKRQEKVSDYSGNQFISSKKMTRWPKKLTVEGSYGRPRRRSASSSPTCGLSMKTSIKRCKDATQARPRYRIIDSTQDSSHDDDIDTLTETSGYCEGTTSRSLPVHCYPDFKVVFPVSCKAKLCNTSDIGKICSRTIDKRRAYIPVNAMHNFCLY
nr:hypothetical transcript [Hymenolepis microstoma]